MFNNLHDHWQSGEARLIQDLAYLDRPAAASLYDVEAFLPVVVEAVRAGQDLARQFPDIFHLMLADPSLEQAFLDALWALEPDSPEPEPDPGPSLNHGGKDRSFRGWMITWRLGLAQLQSALFPPLALGRRGAESLLEDHSLPLLRSQAEFAGLRVELMFEAVQLDEGLQPAVMVSFQSLGPGTPIPPAGQTLRLEWGQYSAAAAIDSLGQAAFPTCAWEAFLDLASGQVTAPLALTLETPDP